MGRRLPVMTSRASAFGPAAMDWALASATQAVPRAASTSPRAAREGSKGRGYARGPTAKGDDTAGGE